jgi:hypothetical protein
VNRSCLRAVVGLRGFVLDWDLNRACESLVLAGPSGSRDLTNLEGLCWIGT